jgi:predicted methyltransferase
MKNDMKRWLGLAGLGLALVAATLSPSQAQDVETLIDQAMTGSHRSDTNKARDKYRHPKETLMFFGLVPEMTAVEITPGMGWYTEILAPVLRDRGSFYAAVFAVTDQSSDFLRNMDKSYRGMLAARPDLYGKAKLSVLSPGSMRVAPPASADMVLTFRNVHNWAKAGTADAMFRAFHDALKPGGILGVVEHRARSGTPFQRQIDSGYMTEDYVIETATKAGFRLVNKSEINANPRDTADYPGGVWTLPPTLRNVADADKPKYLAIGESDRMTLKFTRQ